MLTPVSGFKISDSLLVHTLEKAVVTCKLVLKLVGVLSKILSSTKNKYFEMFLLPFQITLFHYKCTVLICSVLRESVFPQTVGTR